MRYRLALPHLNSRLRTFFAGAILILTSCDNSGKGLVDGLVGTTPEEKTPSAEAPLTNPTSIATVDRSVEIPATSENSPNAIVKRDANGNFSAGTITGNLNGNAATATNAANATNAVNATNAAKATSADSATNASNATNAINATNATNATSANSASTAANFSGALSGDVSGSQGSTVISNNSITSGKIVDGTIVNADIHNNAAIGVGKLAPGSEGQVLTVKSGVPSWQTPDALPIGINNLSQALDTLFGSPQCSATGTIAAAATPPFNAFANSGSAATVLGGGSTYSLAIDTLTFASGQVALTSLTNAAMSSLIQPYAIGTITMTPLGGAGSSGSGFKFPFQMQVTFTNPNGPSPAPLIKFVTINTDASRKVLGACYMAGPPSPARAWVNVTASRSLTTRFTNNTDHEIVVSVNSYGSSRCAINLYVNDLYTGGNFVNDAAGGALCNIKSIVPPGATYYAEGVDSYNGWYELR